MLRLVDITEQETDHITFETEEITAEDTVPYIVYDTSTGISVTSPNYTEDYVGWRSVTSETSTGSEVFEFTVNNTNLYPSYCDNITDYTILSPKLFRIMTYQEYQILQDVLIRFDLVRRRLPNPGVGIASTDGVGEDGVVSFAGGHEKKMTIGEIMQMVEGAIVEINGTSPRTSFWPMFMTTDADKVNNPYLVTTGIPNDMMELVKLGTLIRCLIAVGILEVDISFSTSDSGLQITFDRHAAVKGWHDTLLAEYKEMKERVKWNHANHGGVGLGTSPFNVGLGYWGTLMNNAMVGGSLSLHSVLGFTARGTVPL